MKALCYDGTFKDLLLRIECSESVKKITVDPQTDFSNIKAIDFDYENNLAHKGDSGYFVLPNDVLNESMLVYFRDREDTEYNSDRCTMPIFGVKTKSKSFLAVITGMPYQYTLVCGVKNGKYYIFPRFIIDGKTPYENICVEYHYLPEEQSDYSAMAREYRKYQLERGACLPIKERMRENETLKYSSAAPMIRIRMGWKPAPPRILEQTTENEPPMFVACDFDRVSELLDEMHNVGVKKAEICLVGWNRKGHDGSWPSPFPVCEELGGEEKLRQLIKKANKYGYLIDGHSNSTDAYRISSVFSEDDLRQDEEGNKFYEDYWSGGRMYQLCPKTALKHAEKFLPQISNLGFRGLHYIDVLSIVYPRNCFSEKHPLNTAQAMECNNEIMKISHKLFGGFSSEGVIDFAVKYLDYGLYVSMEDDNQPDISDKKIPFWELVYHGIVMCNPNAKTVNYTIKAPEKRLQLIEYGGRPTLYIHSKFKTANEENGGNWMGVEDLNCKDYSQVKEVAESVLIAYKDCEELSYLQTEFMEEHREISDGVFQVTYSDGSEIIVDYNNETYALTAESKPCNAQKIQ